MSVLCMKGRWVIAAAEAPRDRPVQVWSARCRGSLEAAELFASYAFSCSTMAILPFPSGRLLEWVPELLSWVLVAIRRWTLKQDVFEAARSDRSPVRRAGASGRWGSRSIVTRQNSRAISILGMFSEAAKLQWSPSWLQPCINP